MGVCGDPTKSGCADVLHLEIVAEPLKFAPVHVWVSMTYVIAVGHGNKYSNLNTSQHVVKRIFTN